jgi:hypothetical protein
MSLGTVAFFGIKNAHVPVRLNQALGDTIPAICQNIAVRNRLTYTRSRALNALGNAGSTRAELWNVDSPFLCMISKQTERKTRIKCMQVCC